MVSWEMERGVVQIELIVVFGFRRRGRLIQGRETAKVR